MVGRWSILLPVTLVACCAGLAAGMQPLLALLAVIGLIVAAVAVVNITFAVAAFSALAVAYFGAVPNRALAAGLLVAVAWWIATTGDRTGRRSLFAAQPGFTWLLVGFLAWISVSVVWAQDTGVALHALERYALVLFFFPAVFAAVQSRRDAILVIGAMLLASAGSILFELASGASAGQRFGGPTADADSFSTILLPLAILGAAMGARSVGISGRWRVALRIGAALAFAGVLASESRGAIVASVVVLAVLPLAAGHWRGKALALSLSTLALAGASLAVPGSPLIATFRSRGLDSAGRTDVWTVAWRMIEANPIGGVGVGNFQLTAPEYVLRPGKFSKVQYILDNPHGADNSYLQVGAEMGLVGLALFVGIIASCLACAWHAARRFERARDPGFELIARALVLAIVALLAHLLFFTYTDFGRPFWILLALGPALLAVSKSRPQRPYRPSHLDQQARLVRRSMRRGSMSPDVPVRFEGRVSVSLQEERG